MLRPKGGGAVRGRAGGVLRGGSCAGDGSAFSPHVGAVVPGLGPLLVELADQALDVGQLVMEVFTALLHLPIAGAGLQGHAHTPGSDMQSLFYTFQYTRQAQK